MNIRLTQIDGLSFPNLALMKLSHFFKAKGYNVVFKKSVEKDLFESDYDLVLGSSIFCDSNSLNKIEKLKKNFQNVIIGGTGSNNNKSVESFLNLNSYENYDYSIYPEITYSMGFSQRGCRLNCGFCVVPKKEGKNVGNDSISNIWKSNPKNLKKHIILLDNDFFGQKDYQSKIDEILDNNLKVSFIQGINIRLIDSSSAKALSNIKIRDFKFKRKRIYTAWDNKKDESIFFRGINHLLENNIKPSEIMVYFLCNYWEKGLTKDVLYRFEKMKQMGLLPYPMIFERETADGQLKKFQEYVIQGVYYTSEFKDFINKDKYKLQKELNEKQLTIF